ncbi:folylpolyglutamate synthase/dihydrofolate synthase family protein [soil metagenome]
MFQRVGSVAYNKDLTNTRTFCTLLGNPQDTFKSAHIAGTNGKGSTAHTLAAILQVAGYKTGLYTSPHLKSFTERIKINGKDIGEQAVINFVEKNKQIIEQLQPSFFEMTVAMAFDHFAREKVDIAIIEVGVGGRLDSTNVINPVLSLITNIGYDHQNLLGDTLPEIAFEKAGIIKTNIPVVISEKQDSVFKVFIKKAEEQNAPLYFATDHFQIIPKKSEVDAISFDVKKEGTVLIPDLNFALSGNYQLNNLPGIFLALDVLKQQGFVISDNHIKAGLQQVKEITNIKGRWHILSNKPMVICDTGHNEEGVQQVVKQLLAIEHERLFMVLGLVKDKDPVKILKLLPTEAHYFFTQAKIPRALDAEEMLKTALTLNLEGTVVRDVNKAIANAKKLASAKDLIFIGGSTFVVAEIEEL